MVIYIAVWPFKIILCVDNCDGVHEFFVLLEQCHGCLYSSTVIQKIILFVGNVMPYMKTFFNLP